MVLGSIALQVFGAITSKTAPIVLDYLGERLKGTLDNKSGKGGVEIEALRKEVETLRKQLQSKETLAPSDIQQVQVKIEKAYQVQHQYGLELISEQAHKRWILEQFERLTGNRESDFRIDVWTKLGTATSRDINIVPVAGPGTYKIGDKITLFFRSDKDCYLTLFNLGTSGDITVLFPNLLFQDNFISGGRTYTIPGEGYPFEYVLSGPPGTEIVKAIATSNKVNLLDMDFSKQGQVFDSAHGSSAAKTILLVEKRMSSLPVNGLAAAKIEFEVR